MIYGEFLYTAESHLHNIKSKVLRCLRKTREIRLAHPSKTSLLILFHAIEARYQRFRPPRAYFNKDEDPFIPTHQVHFISTVAPIPPHYREVFLFLEVLFCLLFTPTPGFLLASRRRPSSSKNPIDKS